MENLALPSHQDGKSSSHLVHSLDRYFASAEHSYVLEADGSLRVESCHITATRPGAAGVGRP